MIYHRTYVCFVWLWLIPRMSSDRMVAGFLTDAVEMWDSQVVPTDSTTVGSVPRYFGIWCVVLQK
nr:MAG TPA: hypothetical protein [Caudoviricetes sp.]